MADLLECVLQIKGLRETTDRLRALVGSVEAGRWNRHAPDEPSAVALLVQLVETELVHGAWLRLLLTTPQPVLSGPPDASVVAEAGGPHVLFNRFLSERLANLDLLDRCSAGDLARWGVHGARRQLTVADLVALMLASDTETLGRIRQALSLT